MKQTWEPGASRARIAREDGVNDNQLLTRRSPLLLATSDSTVPDKRAQRPVSLVAVTVLADGAVRD